MMDSYCPTRRKQIASLKNKDMIMMHFASGSVGEGRKVTMAAQCRVNRHNLVIASITMGPSNMPHSNLHHSNAVIRRMAN